MSYSPHWTSGEWRVQCDRCGFDFKASQLQREWTGLRVCRGCWETRHPQDYVRGVEDRQAPPWVRPEPTDTFVTEVVIGNRGFDGSPVDGASNVTTNAANFLGFTYANLTGTFLAYDPTDSSTQRANIVRKEWSV